MEKEKHCGVFAQGPLSVHVLRLAARRPTTSRSSCTTSCTSNETFLLPPKPLLIAAPTQEGHYPVVLFIHGFALLNSHYTQLLSHVASHGFIIVAPQMYIVTGADATQEIADAAAVIDWLSHGLMPSLLKTLQSVTPNLQKIALAGHSRGGKVIFALALGLSKASLKFCAIAGLDPVDGMNVGQQTKPPVLKFSEHSLQLGCPVLIVGAGLGALKRNSLFPPCAPEGVNHEAFFSDCSDPAFYFLATEHGHMDFLDDETSGIQGKLSYCTCKNGPSRAPMRTFAAGLLVAFFSAAMFQDKDVFHALLESPSLAPVKLEPPKSHILLSSWP